MTNSLTICLLSFVTILLVSPALSITVNLPQSGMFCVFKDLKANQQFSGEYVVSGYDAATVSLRVQQVTKPDVLAHHLKKKEGKWEVVAPEDGEYKACFKNFAKRDNFVSIDLTSADEAKVDVSNSLTVERLEEVSLSLARAIQRIKRVRTNLGFQKTRSNVYETNNEMLTNQIQWSSFFKVAVLLSLALGQIYVLTGYFRKQKKMYV